MTDHTAIQARLHALEQRVHELSDRVAITQLIASYGPLVDAGSPDEVAALWSEDGSYQVEGWNMRNRAEVHSMVASDAHQSLIAGGAAHFLGPAQVNVQGDDAYAVCESLLIRRREERWTVARAGANHFTLRRVDGRWQITRRVTRALDGNLEARALLTAAPLD
ncbi:nuclear transport factor 2 family protein [Mycobacterium sp. AMU20-3851]|uniref:nuclear transport factor 2 family protein n=1 Tax=Mycobacterium sp. AMU20-3851 TaxID=3122055 RepID=UPI003754F699